MRYNSNQVQCTLTISNLTYRSIVHGNDLAVARFLPWLILFSIIIGATVHYHSVRFIVGLLGVLVPVILSISKNMNLTLLLFAAKPFIDLSWDVVYFTILGINVNMLRIVAVFLFFFWGYKLIILYNRNTQQVAYKYILFLFSSLLLASVFVKTFFIYSPTYLFHSITNLIRIFDGIFLFLIASTIFYNFEKQKNVIIVIWLSNFSLLIINVIVFVLGNYTVDISQGVDRFRAIYNDAGTPAIIAFLSTFYSVIFMNISPYITKAIKIFYYSTLILSVFVLWITLSRFMILPIVIFYVVWFGYYKRKSWIVFPILIAGSVFLYKYNERLHARFAIEVNFIADDISLESAQSLGSGRVNTWFELLDIFNKDYRKIEKIFGRRGYGAHNEYLRFLMEYGLVGFFLYSILYLLFFVKVFKVSYSFMKMRNHYDNARAIFSVNSVVVMLTWAVVSIQGNFIFHTTFWWSLSLILSFALMDIRIDKRSIMQKNNVTNNGII